MTGYDWYTDVFLSPQPTIGFTSEPGEGGIVAFRDYDKKFSPHLVRAGCSPPPLPLLCPRAAAWSAGTRPTLLLFGLSVKRDLNPT